VVPYISSMSHNNGWVINLGKKSISEFENSTPYDEEGDVGQVV
jgi:hypothetical protein